MVDLVKVGVTTPYEDPAGLTSFDRLAGWAGDADGYNIHGFDADDAEEIVTLIERLVETAQSASGERQE